MFEDTVNGVLCVGGNFKYASGLTVNGIATWDGGAWNQIGSGDTSCVNFCLPFLALAIFQGDLYTGGAFNTVGGVNAQGIAKWDGTSWLNVGGNHDLSINSLYVHNSELYALGWFDSIGGIQADKIASWDGLSWSYLDTTDFGNGAMNTAITFQNNLYVGGNFNGTNGLGEIGMWDGMNWWPLDDGIKGSSAWVSTLAVFQNELYVGGNFNKMDGNVADNIMKWDGTTWIDLGGTDGQVMDMIVYNDLLYTVGQFTMTNGIATDRIATWDGVQWCGLGSSFENIATSLGVFNNELYVGGGFTTIDADTVNDIAKWIGGNYVDTCNTLVNTDEFQHSTYASIIIYPNPTTGQITLTNLPQKPSRITVYNILGKLVQAIELNGTRESEIDLAAFPNGIYLIQLQYGQMTLRKKVIKL